MISVASSYAELWIDYKKGLSLTPTSMDTVHHGCGLTTKKDYL